MPTPRRQTTCFRVSRQALLKRASSTASAETPRYQWRNPVMFVVYVGSIITSILWLQALGGQGEAPQAFILAIALWLWFTVLFANFAEAMAEGRSKAQAASLKHARKDTVAKKLARAERGAASTAVPSSQLRRGDIVYVEQGDLIPGDGEVIEGVASINESAITGESAPVIRAAGSDFNTVTGGTLVLSDWIIVRIGVNPGEAFLDRMIGMVEGAKRQKTPNEIALTILWSDDAGVPARDGHAAAVLDYSVDVAKTGTPVWITVLVALLVWPDSDDDRRLLSAIGVAAWADDARQPSSRRRAAPSRPPRLRVLLLDKTGTITFGNRQASALHPLAGVTPQQLAEAALWPPRRRDAEGRHRRAGEARLGLARHRSSRAGSRHPFTAQTRMSGVGFSRDARSARARSTPSRAWG